MNSHCRLSTRDSWVIAIAGIACLVLCSCGVNNQAFQDGKRDGDIYGWMSVNPFGSVGETNRARLKPKPEVFWSQYPDTTDAWWRDYKKGYKLGFRLGQAQAIDEYERRYPLQNAARMGDLSKIKSLLAEGHDIDGDSENSPLTFAAFFGRRDVAEILLDHGANPNGRVSNRFREDNPLYWAVFWEYGDIVELLKHHGAGQLNTVIEPER